MTDERGGRASPRVLVVDEEEDIRDMLLEVLSLENYAVVCVSSGNAALRMLDQQSFDVILSDVRMPDGDGLSLLTEVRRRNPSYPPVALFSGSAEPSARQLEQLGATRVFDKPCDLQQLLAGISELARGSR